MVEYKIYIEKGRLKFRIEKEEQILFLDEITLIGDEEKRLTEILEAVQPEYTTGNEQEITNKLKEIAKTMAVIDSKIVFWQGIVKGINLIGGG